NADTSDFRLFTYQIKGSSQSEQLRQFIAKTKVYGEQLGQAIADFNHVLVDTTITDSVKKSYESRVRDVDNSFRQFDSTYIDTVKNPIIGIFAVYNLNYKRDQPSYDNLGARLRKNYANLPFVQGYLAMLDQQRNNLQQNPYQPKYAVGQLAPEI